ncbi:hypothetical protein, partial [Rhodococcus koreensis]
PPPQPGNRYSKHRSQVGNFAEQKWGISLSLVTPDAGEFMAAAAAVWSAAFAEFQFAGLEMLLELPPFFLCRFAVLSFWSDGPAFVEKGPVGSDEVFVEHGHVRL